MSVWKPTLCQHLEKYNVCGRQMISKYTFFEKNEFMTIKNLGVETKMTGKYTSVSTRGILHWHSTLKCSDFVLQNILLHLQKVLHKHKTQIYV